MASPTTKSRIWCLSLENMDDTRTCFLLRHPSPLDLRDTGRLSSGKAFPLLARTYMDGVSKLALSFNATNTFKQECQHPTDSTPSGSSICGLGREDWWAQCLLIGVFEPFKSWHCYAFKINTTLRHNWPTISRHCLFLSISFTRSGSSPFPIGRAPAAYDRRAGRMPT